MTKITLFIHSSRISWNQLRFLDEENDVLFCVNLEEIESGEGKIDIDYEILVRSCRVEVISNKDLCDGGSCGIVLAVHQIMRGNYSTIRSWPCWSNCYPGYKTDPSLQFAYTAEGNAGENIDYYNVRFPFAEMPAEGTCLVFCLERAKIFTKGLFDLHYNVLA